MQSEQIVVGCFLHFPNYYLKPSAYHKLENYEKISTDMLREMIANERNNRFRYIVHSIQKSEKLPEREDTSNWKNFYAV